MISRRTCLLAGAGAAAALALSSSAVVGVEAFVPQSNARSVTRLNNDIAPTGEFFCMLGVS